MKVSFDDKGVLIVEVADAREAWDIGLLMGHVLQGGAGAICTFVIKPPPRVTYGPAPGGPGFAGGAGGSSS